MNELIKERTIESYAGYENMDPVKIKAIESRLYQRSLEKKYREKYIKKVIKKKINQQYSYTGREAIATFKDERGDFNWLPSKEGLSIEQWWLDRIFQQRSASKLTKPVPMGCIAVHDNDDKILDDKIREHICDLDIHQEVDFEDDGDGREWILTNVEDLYHELKFFPNSVSDILNNEYFMKLWFEKIKKSKLSYFDKETISEPYRLRPWQDLVVKKMLSSGKKYHQLGLPPRHGKTLDVLDYMKEKVLSGEYDGSKLYLVPTSKSLSSNESFVNDYDRFGFSEYFNIIRDVSLFIEEDRIIDKLLEILPKDSILFLVTDEADLASHTTISVDKINLIKKTFNVVEQIVMTGTGIGKASKIFKDIPYDDINFIYQTYDEMVEMGGEVVERRFWNIQYDIVNDFDEDVLNIRQTIADPAKHEQLAKYVYDWTLNKDFERRLKLVPTDIVMVFFKAKLNKHLKALKETYETMYSDEVKCLILTSEKTSNRKAEKLVKKTLQTMRKNKDERKLVVFSNGMGGRSFSVGKIYRELNFRDSYITSATVQEMARVLTHEEGKDKADIIRIGFTSMEFAEQLYLIENELPSYDKKSYIRIKRYLNNNSFSNWVISENGNWEKIEKIDEDIVSQFIDNICKFSDNTSYIATRLWGEGIKVDEDIVVKKGKKSKTKVLNTSIKKLGKKIRVTKTTGKLTIEDERRLKQYVNIMRCIPSIAKINNIDSVDKLWNNGFEWKKWISISKDLFLENYNNIEVFKEQVDALFRNLIDQEEDFHKDRLDEYCKYI
jgi:hypothetical protein